jgi:nucleoside-diphosphate-sugar epimerase
MRILLVGGTGVLSTDVAIEAIDSGHELYILNRGNRKSDYIALDNVIMADIRNEKQSLAAIGNNYYDVVIDFLSFNMDHLKKTMKIFQGKCKQYIFISSATVYSRNVDGRITEDTPLTNDRWAYAVKKANCETVLKDTAYLYGFEYTIIRPYITYGKTRIPFAVNSRKNQWTLIERIKQDKPVIMWDDGNAVCTLTNTKDFARAILGLCMNERAFGQAFHITSGYELTWNDVIRTYGRLLNKAPASELLNTKTFAVCSCYRNQSWKPPGP